MCHTFYFLSMSTAANSASKKASGASFNSFKKPGQQSEKRRWLATNFTLTPIHFLGCLYYL